MAALQCPACGSSNVININLTVKDAQQVRFYSCHACEKRWWDKDGEPMDLPDVLELARKPKPPSA